MENYKRMVIGNLAEGSLVRLRASGGRVLERRVIRDLNEIILICTEDEYREHLTSGKPPLFMGFRKSDIVETVDAEKG